MTSIKEKIENNITLILLGTLLTGFLAGIAAYKGILEISGQASVSQNDYKKLQALDANKRASGGDLKSEGFHIQLTPGPTTVIPSMNIGVSYPKDLQSSSIVDGIPLLISYPISRHARITDLNTDDSAIIERQAFVVEPNMPFEVSLSNGASYVIEISALKFGDDNVLNAIDLSAKRKDM